MVNPRFIAAECNTDCWSTSERVTARRHRRCVEARCRRSLVVEHNRRAADLGPLIGKNVASVPFATGRLLRTIWTATVSAAAGSVPGEGVLDSLSSETCSWKTRDRRRRCEWSRLGL
jgi:hypothetical protein